MAERRVTGRYQESTGAGERVRTFLPYPLPPADPPLLLTEETGDRLRHAEQALDRLELAGDMVPSVEWFLYAFVRKEAVLSSQIEGTQATLVDLMAFEATDRPAPDPDTDLDEVCNYLAALEYARGEMQREDGLPLSMRLLNEAHRLLLQGSRGEGKNPGEPRRSQNWIGGTRPGNAVYVPPPPETLAELLSAFEKYIHHEEDHAPLVRTALLHAQFETIHPYLDGNGRIGRLLITLLLEHWNLLSQPLLYLSLFFKRHRPEYYRRLGAVRTEGDWEGWVSFFLEGVREIAEEVTTTARDVFALVNGDRARALAAPSTTVMGMRLFDELPRHPMVTIAKVCRLLGTTKPTAGKAVNALVDVGILSETTGRQRDRTFGYGAYLDLLRTE